MRRGRSSCGRSAGIATRPQELTRPRRPASGDDAGDGLDAAVEALERRLIQAALARTGGVQTRAAAELRIDERVLRYKLKKYGIRREGPDEKA